MYIVDLELRNHFFGARVWEILGRLHEHQVFSARFGPEVGPETITARSGMPRGKIMTEYRQKRALRRPLRDRILFQTTAIRNLSRVWKIRVRIA